MLYQGRLGIGDDPNEDYVLGHCPVCCLECSCSKCKRKLAIVSREFKAASDKQGTEYEDTKFEDILDRCAGAKAMQKRGSLEFQNRDDDDTSKCTPSQQIPDGKAKSNKGRGHTRKHAVVPKAPLKDFPREVCGLIELEPGTPDDYLKVYAKEGSYIVDDFPESWAEASKASQSVCSSVPPSDGEAVEDGNVDYCIECEQHGSLLCCDTCPRAFHKNCISGGKSQKISDRFWECHVCAKEKDCLDSDAVDGKKSMDQICATLLHLDPSNEENLKAMNILSKIHEMILRLLDYDFGYMFSEPVGDIEGYKDIVKNPMDLGTICAKLINGGYVSKLQSGPTLDDVILAVLKDVELVWHNCFNFNLEGSAVYRMAAVVSRRAHMICKKSFQSDLSEEVKRGVKEFVTSCEMERGKISRPSGTSIFSTAEEKRLRARKPRGRHKITVKVFKSSNRAVAVVDPALGRVVKIYSTAKSAMQAMHALEHAGHRSEWHLASGESTVKHWIQKSAVDASLLIFGYRWVYLDSLRARKVKFKAASSDLIEMKFNDYTFIFMSAEEALSFPHLSKEIKLGELRESLQSLNRGEGWVEVSGGVQFRRPEIENQKRTLGKSPVEEEDNDAGKSNKLGISLGNNVDMFERSKFVKEDLISGRKLVGFDTYDAAYEDWVHTIACSPTFPRSESKSMEHFKEFYLGGDRNVDGLYWGGKGVKSILNQQQSQSTHVQGVASKAQDENFVEGSEPTPKNGITVSRLSFEEQPQTPTIFAPSETDEPGGIQIAEPEGPTEKRKRLDQEALPIEGPPSKKVNGSCTLPFHIEASLGGPPSSPVPNPLLEPHHNVDNIIQLEKSTLASPTSPSAVPNPLAERENVGDAMQVES